MGISDDLLRALNPAVRPVGPVSPVPPTSTPTPFERKSFDELLDAFGKTSQTTRTDDAGTPVAKDHATRQTLTTPATLDFSRIENASLRTMIAQRDADAAEPPTT